VLIYKLIQRTKAFAKILSATVTQNEGAREHESWKFFLPQLADSERVRPVRPLPISKDRTKLKNPLTQKFYTKERYHPEFKKRLEAAKIDQEKQDLITQYRQRPKPGKEHTKKTSVTAMSTGPINFFPIHNGIGTLWNKDKVASHGFIYCWFENAFTD